MQTLTTRSCFPWRTVRRVFRCLCVNILKANPGRASPTPSKKERKISIRCYTGHNEAEMSFFFFGTIRYNCTTTTRKKKLRSLAFLSLNSLNEEKLSLPQDKTKQNKKKIKTRMHYKHHQKALLPLGAWSWDQELSYQLPVPITSHGIRLQRNWTSQPSTCLHSLFLLSPSYYMSSWIEFM